MTPEDLLQAAQLLAEANDRRPSQAMLRRATSTAYYAVFHALAECCADRLIGDQPEHQETTGWLRVYRAPDHRHAKIRCANAQRMRCFSLSLRDFANDFVHLQEKRHEADYDPRVRFLQTDVRTSLGRAEVAVRNLRASAPGEQREFCAYVLFKSRP